MKHRVPDGTIQDAVEVQRRPLHYRGRPVLHDPIDRNHLALADDDDVPLAKLVDIHLEVAAVRLRDPRPDGTATLRTK